MSIEQLREELHTRVRNLKPDTFAEQMQKAPEIHDSKALLHSIRVWEHALGKYEAYLEIVALLDILHPN
jgi:hypothetical protein